MKLLTPILLLIVLATGACGQSDRQVILKWKLQSGETLAYSTVMEPIDTVANKKMMFNFEQLFGSPSDSSMQSRAGRFIEGFSEAAMAMRYVTYLRELREGSIDIEMVVDTDEMKSEEKSSNKDSIAQGMEKYLRMMNTGVMLRGRVTEEGLIESFWVKNDQKNLIALLFELPGKPVEPGDSWSLDLNFIAMDQNFDCDSAFRRNTVTLSQIREEGNDRIAVLKYDIQEYASGHMSNPMMMNNPVIRNGRDTLPSKMSISFRGIAEFSLTKGRWISYAGLMSTSVVGIMSGTQVQRFALVGK